MATTASREQRRLGDTLRNLRQRSGLDGVDAARRVGVVQSTISRIERYRIPPSPEVLRALCDIYNATPQEREELLELAAQVREASKRSRIVMPRGTARLQKMWADMAERADLLRTFSPTQVAGTLQTHDYVRTMFEGQVPDEDVEDAAKGRLARRKTLGKNKAQQHVIVLTEGALRWQLGSAALMVEQIEVIAEISRVENMRLGIIPWTQPVRFVCTHSFNMYDDTAVVVGTEVSAATFTDPADVQLYVDLFAQAEAAAVFGEDARRELARIAGDYRMLA